MMSYLPWQAKVVVAEQTEKDIDEVRSKYIPVAVNTQILFFCVADMANIDPMYQYSLEWFIKIFLGGISNAERAGMCHCMISMLLLLDDRYEDSVPRNCDQHIIKQVDNDVV